VARPGVRIGGILLLVLCGLAAPAAADPVLSPVTDRDYAIDLYDGVALGSTAVVGMGGAATALANGSAGTLVNPSAPAVRSTTDTDTWSWDYHFDYLNAALSTDYGNTGLGLDAGGTSIVTGGLSLRIHNWAAAVTATEASTPIPQMAGAQGLRASTLRLQLALATWIPQLDLAAGLAIRSAQFDLHPDCAGMGCDSLFTIAGAGLEGGATWIPRKQDFRIGAELATPIAGGSVTADGCADPTSCDGFILPERVVSAWRFAVGGAYRWAPTRWNQLVGGWFRDERSLTVALDLVITGPSPDAYGLEAFGQKELERSGRHASYSVRGGAEYEWLPGRLRVRAGSYWEPGRYDGVGGRFHGTFGVEVRVLQFWFWGARRRGKISLTADVASLYRNVALSIGFWH
jgi:hypothetical protein